MGIIKTTGIVTKVTKYGETSLIVTILTKDFGKISAIANNVRTKRSRMLAGLQLFAYSELVMYKAKSKNGLYNIDEMNVLEGFNSLRTDLEKMAYASYFAEAANGAASEDEFEEQVISLLLNSLYALDKDLFAAPKIKMVFQWRLAAVSGYAPQLESCGGCGCDNDIYGLSLVDGTVFCRTCLGERKGVAELSDNMRKLVQYISHTDGKKIFSFEASDEVIKYLGQVGEKYLSIQLEREFKTLDYLKKVTVLGDIQNAEQN